MSLRNQILALMLITVTAIAAAIVGAAWLNTSQYAREQVARRLEVATSTFRQLIRSREEQLINSAELLTSDYGYKQAVATRDAATINSVLFNHGDRVKADLMFLAGLDGVLVASTHPALPVTEPFPYMDLVRSAVSNGGALAFVRIGSELYQVVVVTVSAPVAIGLTGVGFRLNQDVATELKRLANVDVTFEINTKSGEQIISTLAQEEVAAALYAPSSVPGGLVFGGSPTPYVSGVVPLRGVQPDLGRAVLTVSLAPYVEEFLSLRNEILLITLLAISLSFLIASLLTRTITEPLSRLVLIAEKIAKGTFDYQSDVRGAREIRTLFSAVDKMGEDIRQREERIQHQAEHDALTGVLNRQTTTMRLDDVLARQPDRMLLVCFNIRGFRGINDSLGPVVGDSCLRQVAARLVETGTLELAGRFGGDEFIVAIDCPGDPEDLIRDVFARLELPLAINELTLNLSYSAGYALYPENGSTADDLIRRATIAIDRGRQERSPIRAYVNGEDEEYGYRLKLVRDLRDAIAADDGQLFMNYQPKMSLDSWGVDKFEALIRWVHPEDGFVNPELFIALAEQSSLIVDLTDWVVGRVIADRSQWHVHYPTVQVAINVSAQDMERDDLLPLVTGTLERAGLPVSCLCLEMTERDMMRDADKAMGLMTRYRDAGLDLSVDDYGIGQSSLSKLKQMPVSEIKIDKVFITNLEKSDDDQTIVRSTIQLGHEFGLRVIAEGVESMEATVLLSEMQCDYIQGYHLSRPMKGEEVCGWLDAFEKRKGEFASALS